MAHDTAAEKAGTKDLETEIVHTRTRMADTLDAIQKKLDPELLSKQVKQTVGGITDHAKEQAVEAVQQITDHAKERAMEAIGVANQMVDHAKAEALDTVKQSTDHVTGVAHDATIGRAERMIDGASKTVQEYRRGFMDTVRENPIPAAIAAIGIGWLFMSGSSNGHQHHNNGNSQPHSRAPRYDAYIPDVPAQHGGITGLVDQAKEVAGNVAETVQEKFGNVTDQASTHVGSLTDQASSQVSRLSDQASEQASWLSDQAGEWADQAQQQAEWTRTRASDLLRDSPLAVGAVVLAVGVAVGLALPETQPEHRLMGEARDNLLERAATTAKDTVDKVQQVATEATRAVGNEARAQGISS